MYLNFNERHYTVKSLSIQSSFQFRYTSFKFHQVNDRLHVLYYDFFENNADYRRRSSTILMRRQIIEVKDIKQYIWILM